MGAERLRDALSALDQTARSHLLAGVEHEEHGQGVRDHLDRLDLLLEARDHERPLTEKAVAEWNRQAQEWVRRLIKRPPIPPPPVKAVVVRDRAELDLGDPDEVGLFVGALRTDLNALGTDCVRVDVVVHRESKK